MSQKPETFNVIVGCVIGILILFLMLSSYGVFNNYVSQAARQAGEGWKALGSALFCIGGFIAYKLLKDEWEVSTGKVVAIILAIALGIAANIAFTIPDNILK